ncbi:MAG: bifunctional riboflavin kinase/FAD synthetase [Gemmatimonadota bacterium]
MNAEFRSYADSGLPPDVPGTVVTVGTFDGIHLGHWAVLQEIARRAESRRLRSVLVTFDRHPLTVLRAEEAPPLLTTMDEKKEILGQSGLDYAAFLPFTRALSLYTPEEFVRLVLVRRFRVRELVIGYDHGFGRRRTGDIHTLRRLGSALGFEVDVVEAVCANSESEPISSSGIRRMLLEGDVEGARRALGRPYSFRSPVVHGLGRGRRLGFPTANLRPPEGGKLLPRAGIYAVRASLRTEIRDALLHLGPRPTFAGSPPSVELYILEFDREIYGETVRVEFLARLREVLPFAGSAELVRQMQEDRQRARAFFAERESSEDGAFRRHGA